MSVLPVVEEKLKCIYVACTNAQTELCFIFIDVIVLNPGFVMW